MAYADPYSLVGLPKPKSSFGGSYGGVSASAPPPPPTPNGPTSEARSGMGHFGHAPAGTTGPQSEARSGYQHFNPTNNVAPPPSRTGSESGPGILESWFNQRANGTDPGYQYAMGRGMNDIDSRMAAGGSYNSGARGQQLSDFAANMAAQREGQLDSLAGGASGEHQGRLNAMFNQGNALAGGQAGTMGAYDMGAAGAMNTANQAMVQMGLNKAGVDDKARQGLLNNIFGGLGVAAAL